MWRIVLDKNRRGGSQMHPTPEVSSSIQDQPSDRVCTRRRHHRLFAPLAAGIIFALSACSPPQIGTIGVLRSGDGSMDVLIRLCHGSVGSLRLAAINSYPSRSDGQPLNETWSSISDQVVPLSPPVTGASDLALPFDEKSLRTDVLYEIWAGGKDGNAFSGYFGASELAEIEPGEVLSPSIDDDDDHEGVYSVASPKEFEAQAKASC